KILQAREYPIIRLYDEGFVDENDAELRYLADGEIIVKGRRLDGKNVGDYAMTPTLGKKKGGMFSIVEVNGQPNPGVVTVEQVGNSKNPKIEITGGFYGGPRLK